MDTSYNCCFKGGNIVKAQIAETLISKMHMQTFSPEHVLLGPNPQAEWA